MYDTRFGEGAQRARRRVDRLVQVAVEDDGAISKSNGKIGQFCRERDCGDLAADAQLYTCMTNSGLSVQDEVGSHSGLWLSAVEGVRQSSCQMSVGPRLSRKDVEQHLPPR